MQGVFAQSSERDNAAVWYQRAIELDDQVSMRDWEVISGINWDHPVTQNELAALARVRPMLELMRKGSQKQYSDFHLHYEDGIDMNLQHLSPVRSIAKIAHADIIAQMQQGNTQMAADRIASIIRMTNHLRDDRTVISSLVGAAVFNLINGDIQAGLDRGIISPSESARIYVAMSVLPIRDPFGIAEGVAAESGTYGNWLDEMYHDPEQRKKMGSYFDDAEDENAMMAELRDMPEETFQRELHSYDAATDRIAEALQQDDPAVAKEMLATLKADLENDQFGQMALTLLPAYDRIYDQMKKGKDDLEARKATLKAIVGDKVNIAELMNAAMVYEEASRHFGEIDEAWRVVITEMMGGAEPDDAALDSLKVSQDSVAGVLSLVEKAAQMKRCDFTTFRTRSEQFLPVYLLHMKQLATLVELDARLHLHLSDQADRDITVRESAALLRMVAHLSKDDTMVAPLLAHEIFKWAAAFLGEIQAGNNQLDNTGHAVGDADIPPKKDGTSLLIESYWELVRSVAQISNADPFGYISSTVQLRERSAKELSSQLPGDQIGLNFRRAYSKEITAGLNGDALLALTGILDVSNEGAWERRGLPATQETVDAYHSEMLSRLYGEAVDVSEKFMDEFRVNAIQEWQAENTKKDARVDAEIDDADIRAEIEIIPDLSVYREGQQAARGDIRRGYFLVRSFDLNISSELLWEKEIAREGEAGDAVDH